MSNFADVRRSTRFCAACSRHQTNCRCTQPQYEVFPSTMTEVEYAHILRERKQAKRVSRDPQVDLKKGTVKIPVLVFKTGDGKIFYSSNCDPDIAKKLADQYTRRNQGVRSMELGMMDRDKFNALPEKQVAILLLDA